MRKEKEITTAVELLRRKGDRLSIIQADVLEGHRTEAWVFVRYVSQATEQNKDEDAYCAARDAARYLSGKLELEVLIPHPRKRNGRRRPEEGR
ncbi:hypothetical protein [Bacteroides sp.]|uniref:hypothetical protein n=1 Tax=Bacteroides sp. TaxID=29523 RepID=UPI002622C922|nr:hypothetical protein [Bacteroides sp.]MDD3039635.1 hypothetical protein [Bacteroides sp.]